MGKHGEGSVNFISGKWRPVIMINGYLWRLGGFLTKVEADEALSNWKRDVMPKVLSGEIATPESEPAEEPPSLF